MIEALDIQVKGIVQGVGFRPFVYRTAKKYLVNGWVLNGVDGVSIHAEAETKLLDGFVWELSENAPAAAHVEEITLKEVPLQDFTTFEIRFSDVGAVKKTTLVSPDLATCDDCVRELFDSADRRYRYPFINCTNCGPRFTIIERLPYDRKSTSMKEFPMCPACATEYADPLDRRFHAQPDACFACGPQVSWCERVGLGELLGLSEPLGLGEPLGQGEPLRQEPVRREDVTAFDKVVVSGVVAAFDNGTASAVDVFGLEQNVSRETLASAGAGLAGAVSGDVDEAGGCEENAGEKGAGDPSVHEEGAGHGSAEGVDVHEAGVGRDARDVSRETIRASCVESLEIDPSAKNVSRETLASGGAAAFGPVTWGSTREKSDAVFARAAQVLHGGGIVAVKGLGGFHLVCDANDPQAVATLRARKRREGKAFAVMMRDVADVRRVCAVGPAEEAVLTSPQRPIVLLRKRPDARFAPGLADKLPELGVMLPYTPVQHLLIHDFAAAFAASSGGDMPPMLVMTSGNLHDEPIVTDDAEAFAKLAGVADAFLGNNRAIRARYDDSVVRVIRAASAGEAIQMVRRARGYAPVPTSLAALGSPDSPGSPGSPGSRTGVPAPTVFAAGPEQKNTFTVTREGEAFVSQHVGDMENAETYDAWLAAKQRYETLFELRPTLLACDRHPEYLSTKWAREEARTRGLPLVEVQHHHAHIASVLGENQLAGPVCGVAFDGTGYGMDGAIWGGEVLLANQRAFERFANFVYVPMPGGAAVVKHPLRMAYGALWAFDLLEHPGAAEALAALGPQAELCGQMIERGLNTPYTSSVGRLFDAASALLGICVEPLYEGEPAILLDAAMTQPAACPESSASVPAAPAASAPAPAAPGGNRALSLSAISQTNVSRETFSTAYDDCDRDDRDHDDHDRDGHGRYDAAADRYVIDVVKNTAGPASTAQDTSVVLLDAQPLFRALLDDKVAGVSTSVIARRFHDAFVRAIVTVAELVRAVYDIDVVALSGGVFMNRYLVENALMELENAGFTVAINRDLPPNDGCVSFGQAVVACAGAGE